MEPTTDCREAPPAPRPLEAGGAAGRGAPGDVLAGAGTDASARAPRVRFSIAGRPEPKPATTSWGLTWQWVVAAAVTILLAWLTYSRDAWIPILSAFDLGVHEFGHLLTFWAPPLLCSFAGSFLQVAAPLALGGYFWWRRDSLAAILMVAWSAENLHNVSVYIADAQVMILPLFGDDGSGAGTRLAQHPAGAERARGDGSARARRQDPLRDPVRRGAGARRARILEGAASLTPRHRHPEARVDKNTIAAGTFGG